MQHGSSQAHLGSRRERVSLLIKMKDPRRQRLTTPPDIDRQAAGLDERQFKPRAAHGGFHLRIHAVVLRQAKRLQIQFRGLRKPVYGPGLQMGGRDPQSFPRERCDPLDSHTLSGL